MGRSLSARGASLLAMVLIVGGCRAIVGIEDVTVGDAGAAADGPTFAECRTKCTTATPTGEGQYFGNIENCLCNNKVARVCPAECNAYCDQPQTVPEACRACVLVAVAGSKLQCGCNGGGSGACTTYLACIKTCPI